MLSRDGMKNCREPGVDWASSTADLYQAIFSMRGGESIWWHTWMTSWFSAIHRSPGGLERSSGDVRYEEPDLGAWVQYQVSREILR